MTKANEIANKTRERIAKEAYSPNVGLDLTEMRGIIMDSFKDLKEEILENFPPYPTDTNSEKEKGYHEALDNFIKLFDTLGF